MEPAGRASELAERAPKPAESERASEPAERVQKPAGRASETLPKNGNVRVYSTHMVGKMDENMNG